MPRWSLSVIGNDVRDLRERLLSLRLTAAAALVLSVICVFGIGSINTLAAENSTASSSVLAEEKFGFSETDVTVNVGESYSLSLCGASGYKWIYYRSSKPKVVSVDSRGIVTALSEGTATITGQASDGHVAKCVVTSVIPAEEIKLEASVIRLGIGDSRSINATVVPENASNKTLTWSSSNGAVSVDNGVVTGISNGMAVVTAMNSEGVKAQCVVIAEIPVQKVVVEKKLIRLTKGEKYSIKATLLPENASDKRLSYRSSDTGIARVDPKGVIRAVKTGTANIWVTSSNNQLVTLRVKVYAPVRQVELPESVTLGKGEAVTLEPVLSPSSVLDKSVRWSSSDPDIVSAENGVLTGLSTGSAVVTATAVSGVKASCVVNVMNEPESFSIEPKISRMGIGETVSLRTSFPEGGFSNSAEYSSSAPAVCAVSSDGKVTAKSKGRAIITCRAYNGVTAQCNIQVKSAPKSVTLNKTELTIRQGERVKLTSIVKSTQASFERRYASKDESILTVDQDGNINAVAPGSAEVSVTTYNGKQAVCIVTVLPLPSFVSFDKSILDLLSGDETQLAVIFPEDSSDDYTFSSDHPYICSIDKNGRVMAVGEGVTTLRVKTAHGLEGTCKITVKQSVSWIGLYAKKKVLFPGQKYNLKYYLPAYEYTRSVSFSSSDKSVCTVGSSGNVKAVGKGSAIIRVTTHNGMYDECQITVTEEGSLLAEDPANKPALRKRFGVISQYPELPTGCEVTSLTMVLRFYGFNVTKELMAEKYLPKGVAWKTDFREAFAGDPFSQYSYGCYAPVIVDTANKYLKVKKSTLKARELVNFEFEELFNFTDNGVPVMVWATIGLIEGRYTATWKASNGETVSWYANEHCMVLLGYNKRNKTVYAADPDKGKIMEYDMELFKKRYEELFRQAVVIC